MMCPMNDATDYGEMAQEIAEGKCGVNGKNLLVRGVQARGEFRCTMHQLCTVLLRLCTSGRTTVLHQIRNVKWG